MGGVEIPHPLGLEGHSDADVLMHAICDAVLGALGEVDIGHFFPNTDPRWKGVPSKVFLEEASRQTLFRNGKIVNVDATIIAQEPKIFPHLDKMKLNIAQESGRMETLSLPIHKRHISRSAAAADSQFHVLHALAFFQKQERLHKGVQTFLFAHASKKAQPDGTLW